MSDLLSFSLVALSAMFVIVDPFTVLPIFLAMTGSDPPAKRRWMAVRATLVAFAVLTLFALFGHLLFKVFGITLSAFKVAGGILLLLTSMDMLRVQTSRTRATPDETEEGVAREDVAIVPLAIPLMAGPGSIATAMVLVARGHSAIYEAAVIGAIALTCLATCLMLWAAGPITRVLGKSGIAILGRIMGLLLAAVAIQFVADGVLELMPALGRD